MQRAQFSVSVSVWVPETDPQGLLSWALCGRMAPLMGEEPVRGCGEVSAVLRAHGKLIARLLAHESAPAYPSFRVILRHSRTGGMVAASQWERCEETGAYHCAGWEWTACESTHSHGATLAA